MRKKIPGNEKKIDLRQRKKENKTTIRHSQEEKIKVKKRKEIK